LKATTGRNGWAVSGAEEREDRDAKSMPLQSMGCWRMRLYPFSNNVDEDGVSHGLGAGCMKEAIKMTGPNFSARRMAKEYTEKFLP